MDSHEQTRSKYLAGFAGIIWVVVVMVGYAYTHKPFSPSMFMKVIIMGWQIAVAWSIVSISGGLGMIVFPKETKINPLIQLAIQAALGSGLMGIGIFLLGSVIGFSTSYIFILVVSLGLLLRKHIWQWWLEWGELKKQIMGNRIIASGIGLILFLTLLSSLAPPIKFDALTYHLALPRSYLLAGKMIYIPENMFWGMPQTLEMLNTIAMALGGNEAAVVLGWIIGFLVLIGLLGYAAQRIGNPAGLVTVACILAGGSLSGSLAWGYSEWFIMLYGLGMLVCLDFWSVDGNRNLLWIAAILAGFALGIKYTAGILIIFGFIIIIVRSITQRRSTILINLLIFGFLPILVTAPWWIKNYSATGNPFYPLLFPAGNMDQFRLEYYQGGAPWGRWYEMLILPWQATIWGVEGGLGYSASIGPLFLGLSVLAWIGWRTRSVEQHHMIANAAWVTGLGFLIWVIASRTSGLLIQTRLYIAFFPAWAILAGAGFDSITKLKVGNVRFGRITMILILLSLGFNIIETSVDTIRRNVPNVLLGLITSKSYLSHNLGDYEQAMQVINELPADSKILMLWETRSLACLPNCDPDEVIDRWYDDVHSNKNPVEVSELWIAQGYTHVLVNQAGKEYIQVNDHRFTNSDWEMLDNILDKLSPPVVIDDSYFLYILKP